MTAHYARLHDTTIRRHWEAARKVNTDRRGRHPRPRRAAGRGRLGQAAPRPGHPGAAQRLLRAARSRTCPHANACLTCPMFLTTAEFLPQHRDPPEQTLQIISAAEARGPDPAGRDEPAGRRQPRQDHHRPRRRRPDDSRRRPPMRPDNTAPLIAAATPPPRADPRQSHPGAARTRPAPARRSPSRPSPAHAGVSRSWLYAQPDLRAEIERLREATRRAPLAADPRRQRASDASLLRAAGRSPRRNRELDRGEPTAAPPTRPRPRRPTHRAHAPPQRPAAEQAPAVALR